MQSCATLPVMPVFVQRYPQVEVDISVSNRLIDVIAGGFDHQRRPFPANAQVAPSRSQPTSRPIAPRKNQGANRVRYILFCR
jgi:DNA-binding transcriptional LysR family regulator